MNVPTKHCQTWEEVFAAGVGGYWIDRVSACPRLLIWLPNETIPASLNLQGEHPRWALSGPDEKPTLTPSINAPGRWHGWLTNGELISV